MAVSQMAARTQFENSLRMGYRVSWLALASDTYYSHPNAYRIVATIISGGGGGMGSRPDMNFSETDPPYAYYGGNGGGAFWDTLEPKTCCACDGETFSWPGHPLVADQPVFFTGDQATNWYVHGSSITADTFKLSQFPYFPPAIINPYSPHNFGAQASFEMNFYRYACLGGNGGGVIGDQAPPGKVIGLYGGDFPARSKYWYGDCGTNALGCGGRGGGLGGGAGVEQIGGAPGNDGGDLQGGGGSGAGFLRPDGSYPVDQFGPGGGGGGTKGEIECELKPQYFYHAGPRAVGGAAGPGGFMGGKGGLPLVQVEEWFPDEVEEE